MNSGSCLNISCFLLLVKLELIMKFVVEISYQFLKMTLTFHHYH